MKSFRRTFQLNFFFDIDGPICPFFCEAVENLLLNCFPDIIKYTPPGLILSTCKEEKLSYPIVYPTVIFKNMYNLTNFPNIVLASIWNPYDQSIHSRNRLFRTYLSTYEVWAKSSFRLSLGIHFIPATDVLWSVMRFFFKFNLLPAMWFFITYMLWWACISIYEISSFRRSTDVRSSKVGLEFLQHCPDASVGCV